MIYFSLLAGMGLGVLATASECGGASASTPYLIGTIISIIGVVGALYNADRGKL